MRTVSEPGTAWSLQFHCYEHKARHYVKGVEAESEYSKGRYWKMVSCQSKTNTVLLMDKIILHSCSTGKKPPNFTRCQKAGEIVHYLFIGHSRK